MIPHMLFPHNPAIAVTLECMRVFEYMSFCMFVLWVICLDSQGEENGP